MKIEGVETIWHEDFPNVLFVLVHGDGIVGLGETYYYAEATAAYVHSVAAPLLLGQDATRISAINRALEGYVGYSSTGVETRARSAIDVALWDLAGQRAGMPLYDLLGGKTRDSIEVYNTCAGTTYMRRDGQAIRNHGRGLQGRLEDLDRFMSDAGGLAEELLDEGITGMKIWPFDAYAEASNGMSLGSDELEAALDPIRKIRSAVGSQMRVMIELHALWSVPAASSIIRALQPYQPFWIEDPVRADLPGALSQLRSVAVSSGTQIAAGETVVGMAGFAAHFASAALDVATLDIVWCGGLTQAQRIASLAECYGLAVAPHDCTGPVALTASTHLSLAAPNAVLQETVRASLRTWYPELVTEVPSISSGRIRVSDGPGLGTALQPDIRDRPGVHVRMSRG